jgi:periplasmic copper chaperone A
MMASARALVVFCVATGIVFAHDYQFQSLHIDHPFARATPPGAHSGGVFFTIENNGTTGARLLSVASPAARVAELHQMAIDGGVMKMRAVGAVEVQPGGRLELKPGGYHVMLSDLKQPLRTGDQFPLSLTFENAGTIEVSVEVEAMGAGHGGAHKQ